MSAGAGGAAVVVLTRRELVRFVRQPARVAGAVGTPVLVWVFLASGFGDALRPASIGEASYAAFLLPGMMTMIAVFAAIMSSISIIEDRADGWLQAVLVSPAPRWSIAFGKTLGGSLVALAQAAVLLAGLPLLGVPIGAGPLASAILALGLTCLAVTALGVAFAWRCETTASFHAVMNLVFLPMWFLSGAFFPIDRAAGWLGTIMRLNPLTWCTEAIRLALRGEPTAGPLVLTALFAAAMVALATFTVARPAST